MLRSEINAIVRDAEAFFASMNFALPPFAHWNIDDWMDNAASCAEIESCKLGWDVTDFGSGDFAACGLTLFTLRNGPGPSGKDYAEKAMVVRESQVTPTHYHLHKMEDIVVRAGGGLTLQLSNRTPDNKLDLTPVVVSIDGIQRTLQAGEFVELAPGESVCLPPGLWHRFFGTPETPTVLVGEVSRVNDDVSDNVFFDPVGRFPEIEEDEAPHRLLVGDYANYWAGATQTR